MNAQFVSQVAKRLKTWDLRESITTFNESANLVSTSNIVFLLFLTFVYICKYCFSTKDVPTAFSLMGGPLYPHKKKKKKIGILGNAGV